MHYFNSFGSQEDGENDAETTENTYQ
jgi:hypothetical protein